MRFIPTWVHGWIDYLVVTLFLIAPTLFGFGAGGAETRIFPVLGIGIIVYSLLTDYELGAIALIPVPWHLRIDIVLGLLLAVSPWLFGFAERAWVPHLLLGLVAIGAGLLTHPEARRSADVRD